MCVYYGTKKQMENWIPLLEWEFQIEVSDGQVEQLTAYIMEQKFFTEVDDKVIFTSYSAISLIIQKMAQLLQRTICSYGASQKIGLGMQTD